MDGMISSTVVEGSMTRAMVLEYLEFSAVCSPSSYASPSPNLMLIDEKDISFILQKNLGNLCQFCVT